MIKKTFNKIYGIINTKRPKISYSQCGEDLIIHYIFKWLKINKPTYIDVGAFHPTKLSNTYLFYKNGAEGVCIEPDPVLYSEIKKNRVRDKCLNVGIGVDENSSAKFYVMTSKTLNTFSKEEAMRYKKYKNQKIEMVVDLPIMTINNAIEKHCEKTPDFISIDIEGMELKILKSLDFEKFRPKVFCIETLTYTEDKSEEKVQETIDFLVSKNYFVYADTYINTIFVDKKIWNQRD